MECFDIGIKYAWNTLMFGSHRKESEEGTPVDEEVCPVAYFEPDKDR
jgi:hypothetical protein